TQLNQEKTMSRAGGNTAVARGMAEALAYGGIGFTEGEQKVEIDPLTMQLPQFTVYLFSLYPQPLIKGCGSMGTVTIPACHPGQRISEPYRLPSLIRQPYVDANDGLTKSKDVAGKWVAEDLMRPFMAGTSNSIWSFGQNWEDFGAFWTLNETPTDEEI